MAAVVGALRVELGLNSASFEQGMKRASQAMGVVAKGAASVGQAAGSMARDMRAADIAAYGSAMDDLRGKFNPLFGVIRSYKGTLEEIRQAHRVGAISADEMTAAIQRERKAALDSISVIKGRTTAITGMGAASKMASHNARNLSFQLIDIGQGIPLLFQSPLYGLQNLGFQMAQISQIYLGQGGLKQAFIDIAGQLASFTRYLLPVAAVIGVASAGIGALTSEINKAEGATVGFGDVALATWQLFAEGIYNFVQPAIAMIGSWFSNLWSIIAPAIAAAVNGIIGAFVGAFEAIKATWSALPGAIGDMVYSAADATVTAVQYMIRTVQVEINKFLAGIDRGLLAAGLDPLGWNIGAIDITGVDNPFAGQASGVAGAASAAFAGAQQDYLGQWASAVGERARANMAAVKGEVEGLSGAASGANDNLKKLAEDGLGEVADIGKQVTSTLASGFADMFKGLIRGTLDAMDAISQLLGKLADLFIDQAFNMLFSGGGGKAGAKGGGGLGGLFGGIGKLFGFARGGTIMPGGSGGIDSQFVAFRKSPNERVDITKPGQMLTNGRGGGMIEVSLSPDLEARILQQSAGQSLRIADQRIKQNNKQLPAMQRDMNMRYG